MGDCAPLPANPGCPNSPRRAGEGLDDTGADLAPGAPIGEAPGVAGAGWERSCSPTPPAALVMPPLLLDLMDCDPCPAPRPPLLLLCVKLLPLRSSLARSAPSNAAVAGATTGLPELLLTACALLPSVPPTAGCRRVGVEASLLPVAGLNETHSPAGLLAKLAGWLPATWSCACSVLRLLLREVLPDPAGSRAAETACTGVGMLPHNPCCALTLSCLISAACVSMTFCKRRMSSFLVCSSSGVRHVSSKRKRGAMEAAHPRRSCASPPAAAPTPCNADAAPRACPQGPPPAVRCLRQ
jgi:hypothetical protein